MYSQPLRLTAVIWVTLKRWRRADRRVSAIWMMDDVPFLLRTLLIVWGRMSRLEVKELSFDESSFLKEQY
jgi:hypothetical protein